jgi:hypothetical protein
MYGQPLKYVNELMSEAPVVNKVRADAAPGQQNNAPKRRGMIAQQSV